VDSTVVISPHFDDAVLSAVHVLLAGEVWVPAGIGSHPDHTGTREAALSVVRRPAGGSGDVSDADDILSGLEKIRARSEEL
jgi:hypothetical protein